MEMKSPTKSRLLFAAIALPLLFGFTVSGAFAAGNGSTPKGKPFVEIQGQMIEVQGSLDSLQDQINALASDVLTLGDRVTANEEAIDLLQAADVTLQAAIDANTTAIGVLVATLELLSTDVETNEDAIVAAETEIDTLQSSITQAEDDLAAHENQISALQTEITNLQANEALHQQIVDGFCPNGAAIRQIHSDGTVECEADDAIAGAVQTTRIYVSQNTHGTNYNHSHSGYWHDHCGIGYCGHWHNPWTHVHTDGSPGYANLNANCDNVYPYDGSWRVSGGGFVAPTNDPNVKVISSYQFQNNWNTQIVNGYPAYLNLYSLATCVKVQ